MSANKLPKEYKGFSTAELLAMWENVAGEHLKHEPEVPPEKTVAMRSLVREYRLSPESRINASDAILHYGAVLTQ